MNRFKKVLGIIGILAIFSLIYAYGIFLPKHLPTIYKEYIKEYSKEFNLEAELVYSVIFNESSFNKDIVSHAGAVGLMQIVPETGEWIKGHLSITEDIDLTDPAQNIRLGCWYLSWLSEKFSDDYTLVLAGYNAGHNRVVQWLDDNEYSYDGTTLDNIPYPETSNYVQKVIFIKKLYKLFYCL